MKNIIHQLEKKIILLVFLTITLQYSTFSQNNYSLNSLRQDEKLSKSLNTECEKEGYLYLTPETIFTEKW